MLIHEQGRWYRCVYKIIYNLLCLCLCLYLSLCLSLTAPARVRGWGGGGQEDPTRFLISTILIVDK